MKKILSIVLLVGLAGMTVVLFIILKPDTDGYETVEEIRVKLGCDRITADVRGTDYYCRHFDMYRQDKENDNLLSEDWSKAQEQLQERGLRWEE